MDERLYNKNIVCPVCNMKVEITKVKTKACKVASRDTDFCVYYEGINPIFYDIAVCQNCGYASQMDKFEFASSNEKKAVLENITPKWNKRSFAGERTVDKAIEAFKLALYNAQVKKAKASEMARLCIRLAWLFRIKKDEKEKDFLNYALKYYRETYERENFPVEKLDEFTCMYMIAELYRRTEQFDESVKWFSRIVGSAEARKNPTLIESARDQFQLAKEQMEKSGKSVSETA